MKHSSFSFSVLIDCMTHDDRAIHIEFICLYSPRCMYHVIAIFLFSFFSVLFLFLVQVSVSCPLYFSISSMNIDVHFFQLIFVFAKY